MANLIIKPSAGGQLIIKDEGDSAAITVATNGTTTFAENATLSGTANSLGTVTAGSIGSAVTFPAGHTIKTTHHFNGTRTSVSSCASASTINVLWSFTVNKALSTTDLFFTCALQGHDSANGSCTWSIRETGSSYGRMGQAYCYIPHAHDAGVALVGKVSAADTAAGNNTIDIGYSTNTGRPFQIWNPDSTDQGNEAYYPQQSQLMCMEVVV